MSEGRWRGGGAALTSLSNLCVAVVEEFYKLWNTVSNATEICECQNCTSSSSVGIVNVVFLVSHAHNFSIANIEEFRVIDNVSADPSTPPS